MSEITFTPASAMRTLSRQNLLKTVLAKIEKASEEGLLSTTYSSGKITAEAEEWIKTILVDNGYKVVKESDDYKWFKISWE